MTVEKEYDDSGSGIAQTVKSEKRGKPRMLDATDHQIARLLYADGRSTQEYIARQVCLSRPAVHERIKRLEANGAIRGYSAQLDWRRVGLPLTSFIWVRTSGGKLHDIAEAVLCLNDEATLVEECHLITGDWCLLLKARTESTTTLQHLIDRLRDIPRVRGTMTTVVLSSAGEYDATEQEEAQEMAGRDALANGNTAISMRGS